MMKNQNR